MRSHKLTEFWLRVNSPFNSYAAEPGPVIDPNKEKSKNYMICIQIELNSYSDDRVII